MRAVLFSIILLVVSAPPAWAQIAIIAHPSVEAADVEAADIDAMYSLDETQWSDGSPITLFDLKDNGVTKKTFFKYIGRNPAELRRIWLRFKLSGEGQPPETLATESEVVERVADTPGAIGYVNAEAVTESVQVLTTIK